MSRWNILVIKFIGEETVVEGSRRLNGLVGEYKRISQVRLFSDVELFRKVLGMSSRPSSPLPFTSRRRISFSVPCKLKFVCTSPQRVHVSHVVMYMGFYPLGLMNTSRNS